MCCRAVTIGSVISMYVSYLRDAVFVCFHVFVKWVVWYSGLLWLVIFAVVINTYKSSAPEDGHKVARNVLSNL